MAANGSFSWPNDTGLLLVGHGSREQAGIDEFLATSVMVAELARDAAVEPCFLEFARPTIADGLRALVGRGARHVVVVPVLLFSAGHAQRDIPAAVAAAAAEYPHVTIEQSSHLGCHEEIVRLSRLRYDEALVRCSHAGNPDTALVMVGRGSHDDGATAEMRQFVRLRAQETPLRRAGACFVAMAEPSLARGLDEAAASGAIAIVVEPHLLFGGVLVTRIGQTVAEYAERFPRIRWVTTGHLGPDTRVARAVLCRAAEKLSLLRAD